MGATGWRMKKAIIYTILVLVLILGGGWYVLLYQSAVKTSLVCEVADASGGAPFEITATLTKYRPWVRLWSDSQGMLWVERPAMWTTVYVYLEKLGDSWEIGKDEKSPPYGALNVVNKSLSLRVGNEFFEGKCKAVDRL